MSHIVSSLWISALSSCKKSAGFWMPRYRSGYRPKFKVDGWDTWGSSGGSVIYNSKQAFSQIKDATFSLAGSIRRRRDPGYAFEYRGGRQTRFTYAGGLQPNFLGDHPDQVGFVAAGARAKWAIRPRLSQSPAAAGYCRRRGSIPSQPSG